MSFDERLHRAIQRGQRRSEAAASEARAKALSEEECKRLHSQYRLQLSEHTEHCLQRLPGHFPGFAYETMFGDRGWGAAIYRDDFALVAGRRASVYSRLEITVRPYSAYHLLELAAKGTVRNKEAFSRSFYEKLAEADVEKFRELVDLWTLEYAEQYAAESP